MGARGGCRKECLAEVRGGGATSEEEQGLSRVTSRVGRQEQAGPLWLQSQGRAHEQALQLAPGSAFPGYCSLHMQG